MNDDHMDNHEKNIRDKNPHAGHRKRMRNRFLTAGLDSFAAHEVIELLLFYGKPRGNVNDTAHRLIEKFGSVPGVLEASYDDLMSVENIGETSATLLCLLPHLFRRYSKDKEEARDSYTTISRLTNYCRSLFIGSTVEQVYFLLFDNSMHLLDCTLLAHGTVNSVPVVTRRIAEKALEKHASYVVITHNHPDGMALPSQEDLNMTDAIEQALALFRIPLLEHILVANSNAVPLLYQKRGIHRNDEFSSNENPGFLRSFYALEEDEVSSSSSL